MNSINITIEKVIVQKTKISCLVSDKTASVQLCYSPDKGSIDFEEQNHLSEVIARNMFQFEKVIRSASKGKIKEDQTINCIFIEGFKFMNDADYSRIIRMNRLGDALDVSSSDVETKRIHKIYADGSFASTTKRSGYGGFIEDPDGKRIVYKGSFRNGSSNLMELLAVSEGLQRLKEINIIQINTDSRYVIRGLIQWVHFWKQNNWRTAHDSKVKYAPYWKIADDLCKEKVVEFKWIKGHSGNKEQDFCHQLAKQSTAKPKIKL